MTQEQINMLFTLLGTKEFEIFQLRQALAQMDAKIKELTPATDVPSS